MQALEKDPAPTSILKPYGYQAQSCGYCRDEVTRQRNPDTSASYYAGSPRLTVEHYQALVDRGWRRSGTLLYKPDVRRSCCPHYTIRLPVAFFKPSKDQRQAVNRWNTFVLGDKYIKEAARLYPVSKVDKARRRGTFDLCEAVHLSEYSQLSVPPFPQHQFEVTLEPDTFTKEKYSLFENYQRVVHEDLPKSITEKGFRSFLCNSPLQRKESLDGNEPRKLGSYHQCYRLDGRLIAMGVLDLLPHCVSGVYFIYHEDFENWSFGKIGAMREAALAVEGGYINYYMGYYIHSCIKMRYKADYKPQFFLDPMSLEWTELDEEMKGMLDTKALATRSEGSIKKQLHSNSTTDYMRMTDDSRLFKTTVEAVEAMKGGVSLFDIGLLGIMSLEQVLEEVNLDEIKISIKGIEAKTKHLVSWEEKTVKDPLSTKAHVAALVACVGPIVAKAMVVELG